MNFRTAVLDKAYFRLAVFERCNFEDVRCADACFESATFRNSYLTGSVLRAAVFNRANISNCGLGEIHWEGADLRDVTFSGCTFHMGSSRSGLVNSPYPGHGSKTGFYTDDYEDQYFKRPEEIRKANLRGADLRGATVEETDFYLVDLRGAKYDAKQADHFRRCGAILSDR